MTFILGLGKTKLVAVIYTFGAAVLNGFIATATSSDFAGQVVIALTTGLISAAGIVVGAVISARYTQRLQEISQNNKKLIEQHTKLLNQIAEKQEVDSPSEDNPS